MTYKIRFKDLSLMCKLAIISAWVYGVTFAISFIIGFVAALL